jgi:hypothetical protein
MGTNWYHTNWYNKEEQPKGHHHLAAARSASTQAKIQKGKREKGNPRVET